MRRSGIQFLLISGLGEDPYSSNVVSKGALKGGALNNVAEEDFAPIKNPRAIANVLSLALFLRI